LDDKKRKDFLIRLAEKNVHIEVLKYLENLSETDSFDIIARLVFNVPLLSTDERVKRFYNLHSRELEGFNDNVREIVLSILEKYKRGGIDNLAPDILILDDMKKKNALKILKNSLGLEGIHKLFDVLKKNLYQDYASV